MSNEMINKNIGHATAYAYAVEGGYVGTEEEFAELLGNIAEDLSEIENLSVTVTTLPAGSSATASYSHGVLSLGIPKGDKGDKGDTGATGPTGNGISFITKTGTAGSVDTYTITYTNGNTSTFNVTNGEVTEAALAGIIAAEYDSTKTYAVGDFCLHSGALYECTTAITTAEAWNSAHWSLTNAGEEISDIKEDISDIEYDFTNVQEGKLPIHLVENSYINAANGAFQNYNGWARTEKIPISKYHSITYKSSAQSGYNAFYKKDGTFRSQVTVTTSETTTVVPDDAYYVAFSNTNEGMANLEVSFVSDAEYDILSITSKAVKADAFLSTSGAFVAPYNDCDTFPNETVVSVTYNPTGLLANIPINFVGGTIITVNASVNGSTESAQLAIGKDGTLYARHKWGSTWSAWTSNNTYYLNFSMFPSIGVIGDSFSSGAILIDSPDIWGMYPNFSWPNIVGRSYGSDINSYASSGLSTRDWLTNASVGLQKLLSDAPSSLYLLCLGINDGAIYNEDQTYLGSIADIKPDFTQNPDTFYGNYGRIFEQISAHAPNAKIIFINPPTYNASSPTYQLFTNAIEEIANHYSAPFIDSMDDGFFTSEFFQTQGKSTAHPVAMTYAGMAEAYNRLFCLCVQNNYSYFLDTHWIL